MKSLARIAVPLLAAALFLPVGYAQDATLVTPPPQPGSGGRYGAGQYQGQQRGMGGSIENHSVRGDVTAVSGDAITVKTEEGETYSVATSVNTRFRRQRDLIKISDIHVGDMIAAVGDKDPKAKTVGAVFVIVIDKEQYEKMRVDFGKTWTAGAVQSINGTNIVIKRPDNIKQTIAVDENTSFRERREDITLPDIKVGDIINARGSIQNGAFLATVVSVSRPGNFGPGGFGGGDVGRPSASNPPAPQPNPPQSNH